jgi:hypothetical protein
MATVAHPAVVIGLGGTGQWVLTYLKKNLMDTYGEVPPMVKLLAFDTTGEGTEARVGAKRDLEEERAQVGDVTLDTGEFVYLGGNIRKICQGVAGRLEDPQTGRPITYPHIGSWLQADTYLQYQDDSAYEISEGAGQRRQFGRMAVFYDLAQGEPDVLGKISTAITEVTEATGHQQPVEIYITCSIAGGTGSGMFIDIAHIARKLAERDGTPFAVRGFIVLQNAFDPVIDIQDIMPNAFAAMRELDRFSLVFDREYPIYYTEEHKEPLSVYHSVHTSKLFDSCYLIDSVRPERSLKGIPPRLGIFPSVAECLTALLDSATGDTFAQHYVNVGNEVSKAQQEIAKSPQEAGTALYSSIGTYTFILPVVDIIERNTYKLILELLKRLLTIEEDNNGNLAVTGEGNRENHNPPREEATDFLSMNKSRSGVQNLDFNQQVAEVLGSGRTQDPEYVLDIAALGVELVTWVLPVEQDDVISQTANDIQKAMETSLIAEVPNSKVYRDEFHAAADRIARDVQKAREQLLGREEEGGRKVAGDLQKGLETYRKRNEKRFRNLLMERMSDLLNGITDDPLIAKQGKLPYVREWLGWVIQSFEEFASFMREVVKTWTDDNEVGLAREDVSVTKQVMFDNRDATGLIDRMRSTAVRSQDEYIAAANYLLDLERQEVLLRAVIELAESFKAIAQEAKVQIDNWIDILALGDLVSSGEQGVYQQLLEEQAQLRRLREEQQRIKVYEYLTDDKYEDELYRKYLGEDKWREILHRFRWKLTDGDGFQLGLQYGDEALTVQPSREETATNVNVRFLVDKLRAYFLDIQNETVASCLRDLRSAERAAREMLQNSAALISYSPAEQKRAGKRNFVCINQGMHVTYFNRLAAELTKNAQTARENQVIGLTNKHRCIVLSTTDLLASNRTAPYQTAARAYTEHTGDPRLLHCFPAEVNASEYEKNLPRYPLHQSRRLLSPVLVALLEDKEMARRFALANFYNLVRIEEALGASGENQYVLRLDRLGRRDMTSLIRLTEPGNTWLLDAMTTFVYPSIDQETGRRRIADVTPGVDFRVEPQRVDRALQLRRDSIISGREAVVNEFTQRMKGWSDILTQTGGMVLTGAFRRFVAENERWIKRDDEDVLQERLAGFLDDNRDCYIEQYRPELSGKMIEILRGFAGDRIQAEGPRELVRRLERYIRDAIEPHHRLRRIERMDPDERPDRLTRDLYSIMHLILWDEVERLEEIGV